ncbi:MAG: YihY/virulence factor BrkB family protein [Eubacterium sp.]|nr:YihY/virulence factor BrkB family protein [Eubacterium sp.]
MNNIIVWFIKKFEEHRVSVHAAQVAFFILVSFFPFMMFLITLLRYTPLSEDIILNALNEVIPGGLESIVTDWLHETFRSASGTVLSLTVISTLWAGSKGFYGIARELDEIYEVPKQKNIFLRRLLSLLYTVIFTIMIILSLIVLVYGNRIVTLIQTHIPAMSRLTMLTFLLRSAVAFILFVGYFVFLYRFVPERKSTFRQEIPGAILSAFLWIIFSYLYSLYVDYRRAFSSIYGSLTNIVLLMLWMYLCINIIFLGAMLNQYLSQHKRLNLISALKDTASLVPLFRENKK